MAKRILAWNEAASQFYREIGKKPNGKAHRFYLGEDERQATASVSRLEGLWDGLEARWNDLASENLADTPFPCWDDVALALGQAISKGEWSVTVEPPTELDPDETAVWLASLRTYFPMIQVQTTDPAKVEEGNRSYVLAGRAMAEKEEVRHRDEMREIKRIVTPFGGKVATKETLHDALEAYQGWIERTFVDIEGRTTQTGKKQGERAARIKRYAKDMPLSDFSTDEIESIIEFWRTRPRKPATKKKPGGPYSTWSRPSGTTSSSWWTSRTARRRARALGSP